MADLHERNRLVSAEERRLNREQAYQRVIKQLTDYLPEEKRETKKNAALDGSDLL